MVKIAKFSKIKKSDVIFEIATGSGMGTFFLAKKAKKVITIDINENYLNKVENYFKKNGINNVIFEKCDITKNKEVNAFFKKYGKEITLQVHNPPFHYLYEFFKLALRINTPIIAVLPFSVYFEKSAKESSKNIFKAYKLIKNKLKLIKSDKFILPGGKPSAGLSKFIRKNSN